MLESILAFAAAKWPALAVLVVGLPLAFNQHIRQYASPLWAKVTSRQTSTPDATAAFAAIQTAKAYFVEAKCPRGVEAINAAGKCLFEHGGQGGA